MKLQKEKIIETRLSVEMEPGKLDFFGTGKPWLNYGNPGIQIILITGWGDDSTMPPFDSKENRQKNKTRTGL